MSFYYVIKKKVHSFIRYNDGKRLLNLKPRITIQDTFIRIRDKFEHIMIQ